MSHRSIRYHLLGWVALGSLTLAACSPPPPPPGNSTKAPSTPVAVSSRTAASPGESATPGATSSPGGSATPGAASPSGAQSGLTPLPGMEPPKLSKIVKVKMKTTKGELMIELYPEAAPNAAERFEELVKAGFYDNTPIFRIVPGFVAQFGVNSKHKDWMDKKFKDDPSLFRLEPGTLAFAKAGPDTNSTQVFINYSDNSDMLVPQAFSAFGKITKGFEATKGFKQVGDPSMGLDQGKLSTDTAGYLSSLPSKPDMIEKAEIVK